MHYLAILFILTAQSTGVTPPIPIVTPAEAGLTMEPGAVRMHYDGGLPVIGRLIFPFGVPQSYIDIDLESEENGSIIANTKSGPNGEFRFDRVTLGSYYFRISAKGLAFVRQPMILDKQNFGTVRVAIQLRRLQGKSLIETEDVVSVGNLMQNVPDDAVKALEKALEEQRKGDLVKTASEFDKALRIAPDYYEANLEIGIFHQKQGRRDQAIRFLSRALELNNASRKARAVLGLVYFDAGEFRKAVDLLSEAARFGNTSPDLYFILGTSYLRLDELDLAEETLQRTIAMSDGAMGETHLHLHNIYLRRKEPDRALEQLETFLEKFPDAPERADIQSKADKLRKALGKSGSD